MYCSFVYAVPVGRPPHWPQAQPCTLSRKGGGTRDNTRYNYGEIIHTNFYAHVEER